MTKLKVIKRDGSVVDFDSNKIKIAIIKAMKSVSIEEEGIVEKIAKDIENIAKVKDSNLTIIVCKLCNYIMYM